MSQDQITPPEIKYNERMSSSYTFKYRIDEVWDLIKHQEKAIPYVSDYKQDLILLKGVNTYDEGNIFQIKWKGRFKMTYKIEQMIEKEKYKVLKFECIVGELNPRLQFKSILKLFENSMGEGVLCVWELQFEEPVGDEQREIAKFELYDMLSKMEKYFTDENKQVKVIQSESIIINENIEKIWGIVSNWSNLKKKVSYIAEAVITEGNSHELGSLVILKWLTKDIECHLKVIEIIKPETDSIWIYKLQSIYAYPKFNSQIVEFQLIEISPSSACVIFKHTFHDFIQRDQFLAISNDKRKILKKLKSSLSKEK